MSAPVRWLVVTAVGGQSVHPGWISGATARCFDLALACYDIREPNRYRDQTQFYLQQPGYKYHLIEQLLDSLGPRLHQYDFIWCPDDDIALTQAQVERMFELAETCQLELCQPSIALGDTAYSLLRQQPDYQVRYTGFVEVMCPLFSRAALAACRETFLLNRSTWGLDWAWTKLVDRRRIGVLDAIPAHHTRPYQSGPLYEKLAAQGIHPGQDLRELAARYGISRRERRRVERGQLRYRAITTDGHATWTGPRWWSFLTRAA